MTVFFRRCLKIKTVFRNNYYGIRFLLPTADWLLFFARRILQSRFIRIGFSAVARNGDAFLFVRSVGNGDFDASESSVFFGVGRKIADYILRSKFAGNVGGNGIQFAQIEFGK